MTRVVAGPLAAQMLGDLGADVIKIERRGEGDDVRAVGPPWMPEAADACEQSTYFNAVNRNKRSITIDFTKPQGADLVRRLAAKADVFMENYRAGTLVKYQLGHDDLRAINPRLIYSSVTGFGQNGPYASRSGYDYVIQAMGGAMYATGHPDGEPGQGPLRVGIPLADILAGLNAVIGILAALRHRDQHGEGQWIDVALLDSQVAAMLNPMTAWLNGAQDMPRTGNYHPSAAPYGPFPTSDGHVLIGTFNDREFTRLAAELERTDWLKDPRYATLSARTHNRHALAAEISSILSQHPKEYWIKRLNAAKVSCGPINTMADIENDPQIAARNMIVSLPRPGGLEDVRLAANPIRMSATPAEYKHAPPSVGQDTDQILRELGLSDDDITALKENEIV
jgi:crotonobetainyl-CoA:carnitine CoA-transferase CaiB-like acyl-CoA transferase